MTAAPTTAPTARPTTRRATRTVALVLGAATLLGVLLSLLLGPATPRLAPVTTGDTSLATGVRAGLSTERGYQTLSAARHQDGRTTFAGLGELDTGQPPTPETPYELGSITKTFTGMLLADAVERGELRLSDPVETHLPELAGTDVGASTLQQLATHTAGLPSFPGSQAPGVALRAAGNENPYPGSVAELLTAAAKAKVESRGTYSYSNLGMALLGHAEARAAALPDWPTLARTRLLEPLQMSDTTFAMSEADVPVGAAVPHADNGWPAAYWTGPAFAPAGSSTWTTAADLMRFAEAVLDGRAPGTAALDPVLPIPGGRIGLAWHERDVEGRPIVWHNGGTGGFRTMLALERERRQAVLILGNSTRDADGTGLRLAATDSGGVVPVVEQSPIRWVSLGVWAAVGLFLVGGLIRTALRARDRLTVLVALPAGVAGLLILLAHGPWTLVPAWLWGGLAGLTAGALVMAGLRRLPAGPDRRRGARLTLGGGLLTLAVVIWSC